ncbi:MAG: xanthine dehydrogenase family protein subunit M [Myxococcota bacterium]
MEYAAPTTVDDAVSALAGGGVSQPFAGGTDLMVQMRSAAPCEQKLVDIKRIPELASIELDSSGLRLGAAVSCWEVSQHKGLREAFPGLVEAAELIGSIQIQNRATVGGNLCNASPAADTVPALIAVGAECVIAGSGGRRTLPVTDFVTGPGTTVLGADELLVELVVPAIAVGTADAYLRFIPRGEMDIAVVGAGVSLTLSADGTCTAARVALGAVGPTAFSVPAAADALVGTSLDEAALERAAAAARDAANPIDDKRGTVTYRRTIAGVLTRRATQIAATRARERIS